MPHRPIRYSVDHLTRYDYDMPVSQAWQLARLSPRSLPWQRVISHRLVIEPQPDEHHGSDDSCGNRVDYFALHRPHRHLSVRMQCLVEVSPRPVLLPPPPGGGTAPADGVELLGLSWEQVRDRVLADPTLDHLQPARMREPSPLVPLVDAARRYAIEHLRPNRPWLDAVMALMRAIHRDFEFEPGATTTSTSVSEVLQHRRGVCQDFAHVMLACLRAHGLPARYVSGYLLTDPPAGQPRLMGADASHAWVAAYHPARGWVEFDPTNDQRADRRYVILAWGADYADVVPLRGVILGGANQTLKVAVSVAPVDAEGTPREPAAVPGH
jgi:transglutaminase-like putative cysteine protease